MRRGRHASQRVARPRLRLRCPRCPPGRHRRRIRPRGRPAHPGRRPSHRRRAARHRPQCHARPQPGRCCRRRRGRRRALTSWSGSAPDLVLRDAVTVVPGAPDPAFRPTTSHLSPSATASDTPPPPAPDPSFRPTLPGSPGATRDADRTAYTPAVPAPPSAPRVLGPLGRGPRPGASVEEHVVVRWGDSLWHIAARYLGPDATSAEVAHEWPRWYAANRAVIGGDPDRIQPGQRLTPPTGGVR